jgi:hypothetical protein
MSTANDDRIHPFTRTVAASVIVILLLAFLALCIEPDHADIDFAWMILPLTSRIFAGLLMALIAFIIIHIQMDKSSQRAG